MTATTRPFYAVWPFKCGACGENHGPNTAALYVEADTIVAVNCYDPESFVPPEREYPRTGQRGVMPRGKTAKDRCDKCFMIHASGQENCE